jgi:hypothetical protein
MFRMTQLWIFLFGIVFSLSAVAAVLALRPAEGALRPAPRPAGAAPRSTPSPADRPRAAPAPQRRPPASRPAPKPRPDPQARALEAGAQALRAIAEGSEPRPAKVARHALRRLGAMDEAVAARLDFLRRRLVLLSLGDEPEARALARAALAA